MGTMRNTDAAHFSRVEDYYGETLRNAGDLRTAACTCDATMPDRHRAILDRIAPEIVARFYGCGAPIPAAVAGCRVLDLGCGAGRDVYLLSALVGPDGFVTGIDRTVQQLDIALKHREAQTARFGYDTPNVDFRLGGFEDLAALGIADNSVDLVVSNCAINLSPAKDRVFAEIFRVLKPGGELCFADVFADRRLPAALATDAALLGECLAGALYIEDFRRLMARVGCPDYRILARRPTAIDNAVIEARMEGAQFLSMTVRAFKLAGLEDRCEDYGQLVCYEGGIPDHPDRFALDADHEFAIGRPVAVCGNTAAMLSETRFARYFTVTGDRSTHFGLFDCSPAGAGALSAAAGSGCCC